MEHGVERVRKQPVVFDALASDLYCSALCKKGDHHPSTARLAAAALCGCPLFCGGKGVLERKCFRSAIYLVNVTAEPGTMVDLYIIDRPVKFNRRADMKIDRCGCQLCGIRWWPPRAGVGGKGHGKGSWQGCVYPDQHLTWPARRRRDRSRSPQQRSHQTAQRLDARARWWCVSKAKGAAVAGGGR